jgi:hypothetical protein
MARRREPCRTGALRELDKRRVPIENLSLRLYKSRTTSVPHEPSNPALNPRPRGATIIAAGLLLAALALVILYTSRAALLSPLALVVVAAIGVAALLLQLRLRPNLSSVRASSARGPLWLNALGVVCAVGALFADILHLSERFMLIAALAAVVSFAAGGIIILNALRKHRL